MPTLPLMTSPRPAVHVDGAPHPGLTADLLELVVEESTTAPARCTARFSNVGTSTSGSAGYEYFGLSELEFGRQLTIWQGQPPETLFRLFDGRVDVIEATFPSQGRPELHVGAADAAGAFRHVRRSRVFEQMTDVEVITAIAVDHSLQRDISLSSGAVAHARLAQLNQTDADFVLDRVLALGAAMWVDGQTLVVTDSAPEATPATLTYGESLDAFRVRADLRRQRTVLGVTGWDPRTKQVLTAAVSDSSLPPDTVNAGLSGGRAIEIAFGRTVEAIVDAVPESAAEAAALARAHYHRRAADFVSGVGVTTTTPGLRVGRRVTLHNLGPLFSGTYQVTGVRHRFEAGTGLRTEFDVRRPRLGRASRDGR